MLSISSKPPWIRYKWYGYTAWRILCEMREGKAEQRGLKWTSPGVDRRLCLVEIENFLLIKQGVAD